MPGAGFDSFTYVKFVGGPSRSTWFSTTKPAESRFILFISRSHLYKYTNAHINQLATMATNVWDVGISYSPYIEIPNVTFPNESQLAKLIFAYRKNISDIPCKISSFPSV